jgi:hypothetical protein
MAHSGHPLIPGKLDRQMVIGALKATGSSDRDVLYARKEELLADMSGAASNFRAWGMIVSGAVLTLTIIGGIIGIPAMLFGIWMRAKLKKNTELTEAAFNEYLRSSGVSSEVAAL